MRHDRGEAELDGFRAGFVALVGLPNVGKSTLLNGLVGERLSIVTAKAQTTRRRFLGIYSDAGHQAVFVDTPGILEPRYLLHESMRHEVDQGIRDADVTVLVVDAGFEPSLAHARAFEPPPECRALLCLNKWDRVAGEAGRRIAADLRREDRFEVVIPTCAVRGDGVAELLGAVLERLPESPPLYPPEDIAAEPLRFIAAELVRETCFEELAQELPYSVAVAVEQFREGADPVYVECVVFVERESQKGIVIGKGGSMIRRIGTRSRRKIEVLVDRPVYLDLRVKVLANWRKNPSRLKLLGYPVPPRRD